MTSQQLHLANADLQSLLDGASSEADVLRIEAHVQQCQSCRQRLESMAAEPSFWQKASTLLADEHLGDTTAFISDFSGDGKKADKPRMSDDFAPDSVVNLLQPPHHPEMLGRLGGYEIEREIGRGGMGVVLKAHDTELHRPVAIKMMAPHLASSGAARKRFAREARAAAAVLHPNVIAIHSVSSDGPMPYLVMPYINGPSLEQVVTEKGPLDEKEIVRIAMQIASGLAAAHSQGVVHRDIKPANVLIENGINRVVITDFGLARAEDDASMTQTGWFAGTPNFMSPEQSKGLEMDDRSDLFSLGSVMYFMATGRLPFRAEQPMAVLERIRNEKPTDVRRVNGEISKTLANLINRLLEKQPQRRFQTAAEVHQILEQYLAYLHRPETAIRPVVKPATAIFGTPLAHSGKRRSSRHSSTAKLGWVARALPVAVIGLLILLAIQYGFRSPPPVPQPESFYSIAEKYGLSSDESFYGELDQLTKQIAELQQSTGVLDTANINANPFEQTIVAIGHDLHSLDLWLRDPQPGAPKTNSQIPSPFQHPKTEEKK